MLKDILKSDKVAFLFPARRHFWSALWSILLLGLLEMLCASQAIAEILLDASIQDQMVVQRGASWKVFGTITENEKFSVSFRGKQVDVDPVDGEWEVLFDLPEDSSGDATLSIDNGLILRKIVIGDVWLCSGQSNMSMPVRQVSDGKEIVNSAQGRQLFLYQHEKPGHKSKSISGQWFTTDSESIERFSAVCLAYGAALSKVLNVPVGLIDSSLGATRIESWISEKSFNSLPFRDEVSVEFKRRLKRLIKRGMDTSGREKPSLLYQDMISPLSSSSVKGVFWYQGEGNRSNADRYKELLSTLINDWRAAWQKPDLPFIVVQMQGYGTPTNEINLNSRWAQLRDQQRLAVQENPPAALVVSYDLTDGAIHPKEKMMLGKRAASAALDLLYKSRNATPLRDSFEAKIVGDKIHVIFDDGQGCIEKTQFLSELVYLSDAKQNWKRADVQLARSIMTVRHDEIPRPEAVRYAWADFPNVGLKRCGDKVPVSPFLLYGNPEQ